MTALTLEALTKIFPRAGREPRERDAVIKVVDSINLKIEDGEFSILVAKEPMEPAGAVPEMPDNLALRICVIGTS